jgi:hypothetical protein
MTVPSRREAARLLTSLRPPDWLIRHSCAVADIAAWLVRAAASRGHVLDVALVDAAALLHDADKALPRDDPAARLPHGHGSAVWLTRMGAAELAGAVRDHPVTRLADDTFDRWLRDATPETRIVVYADKRAGSRFEPMGVRFASWRRRYPDGPAGAGGAGGGWHGEAATLVWQRAEALEAGVCALAGIEPGEVRRLRWARRAMAAASGTHDVDGGLRS